MSKQVTSLDAIPEHIEQSVDIIKTLLEDLVAERGKDPEKNWKHEERIQKLGNTLTTLSKEARQWKKDAKAEVGTMSQVDKRKACVRFLQRLSKGERLKAYEELMAHETGLVGGIDLHLGPCVTPTPPVSAGAYR